MVDDELVEEVDEAGSEVTGAVVSGIVVGPAGGRLAAGVAGQQEPAGHAAAGGEHAEGDEDDQEASPLRLRGLGAGGRGQRGDGSLSRPWTPDPARGGPGAAGRRAGPQEAATAVDGLLEVAADPPLLEEAVAVLLAGQPAMASALADAAAAPDPPSASPPCATTSPPTPTPRWPPPPPGCSTAWPPPPWPRSPTAPWSPGSCPTPRPPGVRFPPCRGRGGRDRAGALLNAVGTRELAARLPTLVVATAVKLVGRCSSGWAGRVRGRAPGAVAAVVVGGEVLSPAEAGRRAAGLDRA